MAIDFEKEGLLKGTRGNARKARLALLEDLAEDGVPLEELRKAVKEERLALLPVERVLAAEERYTVDELAEKSGVEVDFLIKQRQDLGLPVPDPKQRAFTEDDLEAARRLRAFRDAGLPDEEIQEMSRVLGMTMARVAEAARGAIARSLTRPGDTELDVGLRFAQAAHEMSPLLGSMLEYVYTVHQREVIRRDVISRAQLAGETVPGSSDVAVCFADLVEFTKLGEQLPPEELGGVATRLGEMARETVAPPVSLVKLIGDAAMLVSPDPPAMLDAALSLVEAADAEGEGFPLLRAGVAYGPALNRGGDWYGRPVNMAARITDIARPGSVLCAEDMTEVSQDGYRWSSAGERQLKGISGGVRLFRVRHQEPEAAADRSG